MNEQQSEYDAFAPFYDAVMGEPTETVKLLDNLIQKYNPEAKSTLELACGTGNILIGLGDKYERVGLDNSTRMLEIAREKAKSIEFVHGDMTNFDLGRKFDVVLCVFDSINHLVNFSDWEKVFNEAAKHLNDDGIFIFDLNTITKLKRLSQSPAMEQDFDGNKMDIKITENDGGVFNWHVKIVEGVNDVHEMDIPEVSFPIDQIESAVANHLDIKDKTDASGEVITSNTDRVYFICQKRVA